MSGARSVAAALALGAALALACGDRGDAPREYGCGCFSSRADLTLKNRCDAAPLCPTVNLDPPRPLNSEAAVDCVLEALRAGEPGTLEAPERAIPDAEGEGQTYIFLNGDPERTAYIYNYGWIDLEECSTGMAGYRLAEPEHFVACAELHELRERLDCALAGLRDAELETCWEAECDGEYE